MPANCCRSSGEIDANEPGQARKIRRMAVTMIATIEQIEAIYGQPNEASTAAASLEARGVRRSLFSLFA
jgi:hypothetical protein